MFFGRPCWYNSKRHGIDGKAGRERNGGDDGKRKTDTVVSGGSVRDVPQYPYPLPDPIDTVLEIEYQ